MEARRPPWSSSTNQPCLFEAESLRTLALLVKEDSQPVNQPNLPLPPQHWDDKPEPPRLQFLVDTFGLHACEASTLMTEPSFRTSGRFFSHDVITFSCKKAGFKWIGGSFIHSSIHSHISYFFLHFPPSPLFFHFNRPYSFFCVVKPIGQRWLTGKYGLFHTQFYTQTKHPFKPQEPHRKIQKEAVTRQSRQA